MIASLAAHFSRFLSSAPDRLHVAAHSHHPWPDVSYDGHVRAWLDAAAHHDDKWEVVYGGVLPAARGHIARILGLPDASTLATAPNTHELLLRILSCLPAPTRILTSDSEFHSFTRQSRRLEEEGLAVVERVPAEPFDSFADRLCAAAEAGGHHLVFVSHVHFNSGCVLPDLAGVCAAVPDPQTFVVFDGYHAFMALPVDLDAVADRAFYLAGGYKYAMAGEGACFLHCPPGYGPRPVDTGWFATFGELTAAPRPDDVRYPADGGRFAGSTFDPSAWYRFNAVQEWLSGLGVTVGDIHAHAAALQRTFLDRLDALALPALPVDALLPPAGGTARGHFLTFRLPEAASVYGRLRSAGVVTDHRGDRLRLGFGIYQDEAFLDRLAERLAVALR